MLSALAPLCALLFFTSAVSATSLQPKETVRVALMPTSVDQREMHARLIQQFERQHPAIKIVTVAFEHESYKQRMEGWLSEANPPADLLQWFAGERLLTYARKNLLAPMPKSVFSDTKGDAFSPAMTELVSLNGTPYALPMNLYQWGIYANTDVLRRQNASIPETLEALPAFCRAMHQAGVAAFAVGGICRGRRIAMGGRRVV